jgi:ABC-2 type transport system permease protein
VFWHLFKYRIKGTVRDVETIFWTLAFPLIMATFFGLVFSNLTGDYVEFETVNIGIIESEAYLDDAQFQSSLKEASQSEGKPLFDVAVFETKDQALEALKNKEISGYVEVGDELVMNVSGTGFNQSIMKTFLDWYAQMNSAVNNIIEENPAAAMRIQEVMEDQVEYTREKQTDMKEPDSMITYYYALIAMTCLYGAFMGMREVTFVQANQSPQGARQSVAPTHKLKVFASSLCAVTLIQFTSILILIMFLVFVFKVEFANQVGYVLLGSFAGCCLGVSFGALVSAIVKKRDGVKVAIIISVSMALSFAAGMMQSSIKFALERAVPALAYLLPGNLIANTFYALYYYDGYDRFLLNVAIMFGMAGVMYLIVFMIMRRQQYASI